MLRWEQYAMQLIITCKNRDLIEILRSNSNMLIHVTSTLRITFHELASTEMLIMKRLTSLLVSLMIRLLQDHILFIVHLMQIG